MSAAGTLHPGQGQHEEGGGGEGHDQVHYHGITLTRRGRWRTQVCHNGKCSGVGHFDTAEEAARVYDRERLKLGPPSSSNRSHRPTLNFARAAWADTLYPEDGVEEEGEEEGCDQVHYNGITLKPSGRWAVQVQCNKKTLCCGTFGTKKEAAIAYDRERLKLGPPTSKHASRPKLNFARAAWATTLYPQEGEDEDEDDDEDDDEAEEEEEEEEEIKRGARHKRARLQGRGKDAKRAKRSTESESKHFQRAMAGATEARPRQASEVARFGIHYAFH